MHRNRYTDEIGVDSGDRILPRSYACALLVMMAVGAWFSASALRVKLDRRQEAERVAAAAAAAQAPARTVIARK